MTSTGKAMALQHRTHTLGTWVSFLGSASLTALLPLWLFWDDSVQRRWAMTACLAAIMLCAFAAWVHQRAAGRHALDHAFAAVRPVGEDSHPFGSDDRPLPSVLPAKRSVRARAAAAVFCCFTALVVLAAMAAGTAVRPSQIERIHAAGGVVKSVEVRDVSDSVRHDPSRGSAFYTANARVSLPDGQSGKSTLAEVRASTDEELRPGSRTTVLFAPSNPGLGAVQGKASDLRRSLAGMTLPLGQAQLFLAVWIVGGISLILYSMKGTGGVGGFSASSRSVRALRGKCAGSQPYALPQDAGKSDTETLDAVLIETTSGLVHVVPDTPSASVATIIGSENLWLCWDKDATGPSTAKTTPGVLIGDSGWVLHVRVVTEEARRLTPVAITPGQPGAPVDAGRIVGLWDPRSSWPLHISPVAPIVSVLAAMCAGALLLNSMDGWRWWLAVAGMGCVFTICAAYTFAMSAHARSEKSPAGTQ